MARKLLLVVLSISWIIEAVFSGAVFIAPKMMMDRFGIPDSDATMFLATVLAWMLLFITVVCAMACFDVLRRRPSGWALSYALGAWWVGIGLALWLGYGKVENLFLDACKGALILGLATASRRDGPFRSSSPSIARE